MELVIKLLLHIRYANERLGNIVLGVLYPIVFPFYVCIYRRNREKERETAVYPIINHFYHATLINYVVITALLTFTYSLAFFVLPYKPELQPIILSIASVCSDYYAVFFNVHHLILSLLAIQRFLLYFFPEVEEYVNLKGKSIYIVIYGLYFLFYLKISVIYVAYFFIWEDQQLHDFFANMSLIAIFPIVNHFYRTICISYMYLFIYYCCDWFKILTNNQFPTLVNLIDTVFPETVKDIFHALFDVHEIILSLLAVQKYLIYFHPSIESKISYKGRGINFIMLLLYVAYYGKIALVHMIFIGKYDDYTQFYVIEHLTLCGITMTSSLFYLPILKHIKKHSHLQSVIKKKPDRYILIQTYSIVVTQFSNDIYTTKVYNQVSIPVLIQVSYLVSNQNNIKKLRKIKIFRRIFCCKKEGRTEPLRFHNDVASTLAS
ncbi:hypothetical protein CAEBREN_02106 [Caenorhabditis brenneri]|uniref:Serpentine Receptor, class Z n=1 Tax=Caenorhabditis brenneri TaxID=135651 RepID=G0NTK9_CAEBE|nr:hypothetical protein CAEBREN_02106 [Caenorhabditis brenneri]